MDSRETKRTVPVPSAPTDGEQPISQTPTASITEETTENNPPEKNYAELLRKMQRMNDPAYLPTISMNELYENVYQSRPPVIDGLLYPGTYLFAGAPKVGKSFLMAQLAYHVSTGLPLWDYPVHKGTVLYLALEDDHRRLQERLYRMFGMEATTENLLYLVNHLPEDCTWSTFGIGRGANEITLAALALGGNIRVGLEDNVYYNKGVLAEGSEQFIGRVKRVAAEFGKELATPDEARAILGLSRC